MLLPWPRHSPFCSLCSGTLVHLLFLGYVSLIGTCFHCRYSVTQSWPTLCDPMDYSPPGSSVHGTFQSRILEWVAISSSRGSSRPKDQTSISYISRFRFIYHCATWEAPILHLILAKRLRSDLHLFCNKHLFTSGIYIYSALYLELHFLDEYHLSVTTPLPPLHSGLYSKFTFPERPSSRAVLAKMSPPHPHNFVLHFCIMFLLL